MCLKIKQKIPLTINKAKDILTILSTEFKIFQSLKFNLKSNQST